MRMLQKNKTRLWYALYSDEVPVTEIDDDGTVLKTGETKPGYTAPVMFYGNIALSGGESEAVEFGLNLSDYSAKLVLSKGRIPIDETSLIWEKKPIVNEDGTADEKTADYTVVKVAPSKNVDKFALQKRVKNHG